MQIVAEWAGHFYDPAENSDKIWSAAYTDTGDYLAVWGRRGTTLSQRKYQSQTKQFGSAAFAQAEFNRMVRQKERKGYQNVPFEDSRFGNIPSFRHTLTGSSKTGSGLGRITGRRVLERIQALIGRIASSFEPDTMLVEAGQLQAAAGLVLEYSGRERELNSKKGSSGSETETRAESEAVPSALLEAALEELRGYVRQALLA